MIARLYIALPFNVTVPDGAHFKVYSYEDEGYRVSMFPPCRSDRPVSGDIPDRIEMNGAPAFIANAIRIEFERETFDRTASSRWDPPEPLIRRAADSFITRLRYVTRGAQIPPFRWPHVALRLRYLQDDGTELAKEENLVQGRGTTGFSWSLVGVNPDVWDDIHQLPLDYAPPIWNNLRLDAQAALPDVGTAVVLAVACLEVFIAQILDSLAERSPVPDPLWEWINDRGDWLREPTSTEQFDVLLKVLTQHSLKDDQTLWEALKNLKTARNSFTHEGVAKLGGKPLAAADAARLVARASEIIGWVRQWLPDDLKWIEFEQKIQFKIQTKLL